MASRQSSSNTLVEGMNQVESKVGCTDPSRKRELQEKILATRCFFKQHEKCGIKFDWHVIAGNPD